MSVKLLKIKKILHPASFDTSPKIWEIQYIETPSGVVAIDFWYHGNSLTLHHISEPRPLHPGETF